MITVNSPDSSAFSIISTRRLIIDQLVLNHASCESDTKTYGGCGVRTLNTEFISISNTLFDHCNSVANGGAITIVNATQFGSKHNIYRGNSGVKGGALFLSLVKSIMIDNDQYMDNIADLDGGAIALGGQYTLLIRNSRFERNMVINEYFFTSGGGAISLTGYSAELIIDRFDFTEVAGVKISNCQFNHNSVSSDGGAILVNSDAVWGVLQDSTFEDNFALRGGAIAATTFQIQVQNCIFSRSTATEGGAIYMDSQNFTISDSMFFNNSAKYQGGALFSGSAVAAAYGCVFSGNSAQKIGGAISTGERLSKLLLYSSTFQDNNAKLNGGALFTHNMQVLLQNCTFLRNEAQKGGAISSTNLDEAQEGQLLVIHADKNTTFSSNHASTTGSDVFVYNSQVFHAENQTVQSSSNPVSFSPTSINLMVQAGAFFSVEGALFDSWNQHIPWSFNQQLQWDIKHLLLIQNKSATLSSNNTIIFSGLQLKYGNQEKVTLTISSLLVPISFNYTLIMLSTCPLGQTLDENGMCARDRRLLLLFLLFVPTLFIPLIVYIVYRIVQGKRRTASARKSESEIVLLGDEGEGAEDIIQEINKSLFELDLAEISEMREIGRGGSSAIIIKGKWRNQQVAVKLFSISSFKNVDEYKEFEHELTLLNSLHHPYVVCCLGACLKPPRVGIVMEYCEKGTLTEFITKNRGLIPWKTKLTILSQIANGMSFLHAKNIIHRDLKSDNILLTSNLVTKISDFGLSKEKSQSMTRHVGTGMYMAPELVNNEFYDEKCDVFSFSLILFQLLVETNDPFEKQTPQFGVEFLVAKNPLFRPQIPLGFNILPEHIEYIELMSTCWKHAAEDRPSFSVLEQKLTGLITKFAPNK